MYFVWISEQTAIISLYNINWLVCITETECVYCAVRTGCLYTVDVNLILQSVALNTLQSSCPQLFLHLYTCTLTLVSEKIAQWRYRFLPDPRQFTVQPLKLYCLKHCEHGTVLERKSLRKATSWNSRCTKEGSIIEDIRWKGLDWMRLTQGISKWHFSLSMLINFRVSMKLWRIFWLGQELSASQSLSSPIDMNLQTYTNFMLNTKQD
jgi:hypothetical protein